MAGGAPIGNTNGKKENRIITDALRRAVTQNPDKLKKACEKVLDDAAEGNLPALTYISDRLDGKPSQTIAGDPDAPLQTINKIVLAALDDDRNSPDTE